MQNREINDPYDFKNAEERKILVINSVFTDLQTNLS